MAKKRVNPKPSIAPLLLMASGGLLIIAILVWQVLANSSQPTGLSNPGTKSTTSTLIPSSNITRINLSDAKTALDGKKAVFVDVRDADIYQTDHIPGALNIPLSDIDNRYIELDPAQWIITYCT